MRPVPYALLLMLTLAGAARAQLAPAGPPAAAPAVPDATKDTANDAANDATKDTASSMPANLSFSGFATLGVGRSSSDAVEFVRYNQAEGATRHITPGLDSIVGLQLSYVINPATSLTAQSVIHRQVNNLYQPELSLAFLRRKLNDEFTLRLGRMPSGNYLTSEYQHVGYASTMARPPAEVYTTAGFETFDGADLSYQRSFGATTLGVRLLAGMGNTEVVAANGDGQIANLHARTLGMSVTLEQGALLLRAAYYLPTVSTADVWQLASLRTALAQAGYAGLAQDLTLENGRRFRFANIGLLYDAERLQVQAEYVRRSGREASYVPEQAAWYAMAGYRFGPWMPYIAHARLDQTGSAVSLPAGFPSAGALAQGVRYGLLTGPEQHTTLAGVRWNVAPSRAIKLQLDHIRPTTKNGTLVGGPPQGFGKAVTVVSLSLDLLF